MLAQRAACGFQGLVSSGRQRRPSRLRACSHAHMVREYEDYAVWESHVERALRGCCWRASRSAAGLVPEVLVQVHRSPPPSRRSSLAPCRRADALVHVFCFFREIARYIPSGCPRRDGLVSDFNPRIVQPSCRPDSQSAAAQDSDLPGNFHEYAPLRRWTGRRSLLSDHLDALVR